MACANLGTNCLTTTASGECLLLASLVIIDGFGGRLIDFFG
jgi:hypothetical protein